MTAAKRKEVVVVGLGAFGSAALWRLAARGVDVAGIERFDIGHDQGSSHGSTRLFRVACQEHVGLSPIALKSLALWQELGSETGQVLVRQVGALMSGAPQSRPIVGAIAAAERAGLPYELLDRETLGERYPMYAGLQPSDVGLLDPTAGVCYPERTIRAQVAAARRLGADVRENTPVIGIEQHSKGVTVRTATEELEADQVIVAAGAWLPKLVPGLPLRPIRTPLYWWQPRDPDDTSFQLGNFPPFIRAMSPTHVLWGHGAAEDFAIKIGLEYTEHFSDIDPDAADRDDYPADGVAELVSCIQQAFPDIDPAPQKIVPCMVTRTPDGQFVVGRPDSGSRVIVAGGDHGHGFKHAAGIGEILAQIAVGEEVYGDTSFIDAGRFDEGNSRND